MRTAQSASRVLSNRELVQFVHLPTGLTGEEVRDRLDAAERFIDFDDTLWLVDRGFARMDFCGKPLARFLAERPFVMQTWNPEDASRFFLESPGLAQPLLVVEPPTLQVRVEDLDFDPCTADSNFDGLFWVWKDLSALGVHGKEVFDDDPDHLFAPGCRVVTEFDPW